MATSANVVGLEGANTMFATVSQIQDGPAFQRLLFNTIVFFYLQNPVKQNLDLKRSERRPTGGKVARDGHVSKRSERRPFLKQIQAAVQVDSFTNIQLIFRLC